MMYILHTFVFTLLVVNTITEPMTSIQIQNYDGPIYLHSAPTFKEEVPVPVSRDHRTCDRECSCVSKPSTRCLPINTASESSCTGYYVGNYQQYAGNSYSPPLDTKYYVVDQRHPGSSDCRPSDQCLRDEKCPHRCTKCSC